MVRTRTQRRGMVTRSSKPASYVQTQRARRVKGCSTTKSSMPGNKGIPQVKRARSAVRPQNLRAATKPTRPLKDVMLEDSFGSLEPDHAPQAPTRRQAPTHSRQAPTHRLFPCLPTPATLSFRTMSSQICTRRVVDVEGDGNCMYRAISLVLFGHDRFHFQVRMRVLAELKRNPVRYSSMVCESDIVEFAPTLKASPLPLWERFLAYTQKTGSWGSCVTLLAAANAYERNICIVPISGHAPMHILKDGTATSKEAEEPPIILAFKSELHYMATVAS